jgi:squalene-hopene/tetraprenyl-beta-curcumene cyclase
LLAAAGPHDAAATKAVSYLVDSQNEDGSWSEPDFTGTGFPGVFYLKYHLYRNSFPVYALARYSNQSRGTAETAAFKLQPGEFRLRSGF